MPRIDFSFSGWVRGADIKEATDTKIMKVVDVSEMSAAELIAKIKNKEMIISFSEAYVDAHEVELDLFDMEEH